MATRWSIDLVGDRIVVHSPFEMKEVLKGIPGATWDKAERAWTYPATAASASGLEKTLNAGIHRTAAFTAYVTIALEADRAEQAIKTATVLPPVERTALPAWLHQLQAYHFARPKRAAMLALDMGTGKTKVTLDLIQNSDDREVLVVCPKSVVNVWPKEVRKHMLDAAEWDVLPLAKGTLAKRTKALLAAVEKARKLRRRLMVVVNYEAVWREPLIGVLKGLGWDRIVADESHRIKAPNGSQSRAMATLGARAARRLALTGTPMPHSPLDIYGQYRFLDPTIFGTSFARFRNTYANMGGYGGHQVMSFRNQEEMNRRVYSIAHRVMARDVLDLIPPQHETRYFEMNKESRGAYEDLRDDYMTFLEGREEPVTASNALVRLLRMQQLTGGFLPDVGGARRIDTGKVELLDDLLEDLPVGEPVVVFCRFVADLDAIEELAAKRKLRYGELSGRRRDALNEDAELAEGVQLAGVQMASGGVGIDLTRARYCVYYSLGFSLGEYEQSLARVQRPGQTRRVTYYHLLAERSVDDKVYATLEARKNVVEALLEGDFE